MGTAADNPSDHRPLPPYLPRATMPFAPKSKGASVRVRSSSSSRDDDVKSTSAKMGSLKIRSKSSSKRQESDDDLSMDEDLEDDDDDDEVTEEDLLKKKKITPNDVLNLNGPCKKFLCKNSDNTYMIDFVSFKIRDMDHGGRTLFEVKK